ncbi:unnamed protein product [Lupinus luteus]|uniref:Uncharacterized protein n=1 Tax=Lupinus luteus TaxID=3873 RepID=A0AAV1X0J0_LUPLU
MVAGEASWINNFNYPPPCETRELDSFPGLDEEVDKEEPVVSMDILLPGELLETVSSESFLWSLSHVLPQKPRYFMFTSSNKPTGLAYDPVLCKWHDIELPCTNNSNWFIASSYGLVCFMDNDSISELLMCNPITESRRKLEENPGLKFSDYSALAISVSRKSHSYDVAIVKSNQIPDNFL